jgi:hypothetical protein
MDDLTLTVEYTTDKKQKTTLGGTITLIDKEIQIKKSDATTANFEEESASLEKKIAEQENREARFLKRAGSTLSSLGGFSRQEVKAKAEQEEKDIRRKKLEYSKELQEIDNKELKKKRTRILLDRGLRRALADGNEMTSSLKDFQSDLEDVLNVVVKTGDKLKDILQATQKPIEFRKLQGRKIGHNEVADPIRPLEMDKQTRFWSSKTLFYFLQILSAGALLSTKKPEWFGWHMPWANFVHSLTLDTKKAEDFDEQVVFPTKAILSALLLLEVILEAILAGNKYLDSWRNFGDMFLVVVVVVLLFPLAEAQVNLWVRNTGLNGDIIQVGLIGIRSFSRFMRIVITSFINTLSQCRQKEEAFAVGQVLQVLAVRDNECKLRSCRILAVRDTEAKIQIHYEGEPDKFDEWLPKNSSRISLDAQALAISGVPSPQADLNGIYKATGEKINDKPIYEKSGDDDLNSCASALKRCYTRTCAGEGVTYQLRKEHPGNGKDIWCVTRKDKSRDKILCIEAETDALSTPLSSPRDPPSTQDSPMASPRIELEPATNAQDVLEWKIYDADGEAIKENGKTWKPSAISVRPQAANDFAELLTEELKIYASQKKVEQQIHLALRGHERSSETKQDMASRCDCATRRQHSVWTNKQGRSTRGDIQP